MRRIKIYESFDPVKWVSSKIDKLKISRLCRSHNVHHWTLNEDGTIDVHGDVSLFAVKGRIPIKFGRVSGSFYCHEMKLETLEGSPSWVGDDFVCNTNNLKNLVGGPRWVGGGFYCGRNPGMVSLSGSPDFIGGGFDCSGNKIKTLIGGPKVVDGAYWCESNCLKSLDGAPKNIKKIQCSYNWISEIGNSIESIGELKCSNNPIQNIFGVFGDTKSFMQSLDWNYLRGNKIIKSRFEEACAEINISLPKIITGYEYI